MCGKWFNFKSMNGDKTDLNTNDIVMKTTKFDPNEVRKAVLWGTKAATWENQSTLTVAIELRG
jgi:cytidylate kinase